MSQSFDCSYPEVTSVSEAADLKWVKRKKKNKKKEKKKTGEKGTPSSYVNK